MLAFTKDITETDPHHPQESQDTDLKRYMEYQRKLNHKRIVYYTLEHGTQLLQKILKQAHKAPSTLDELMHTDFPDVCDNAPPKTIKRMLKNLIDAHNSTTMWYRMNSFYYALVYDCAKRFIEHYNKLVVKSKSRAEVYYISECENIDFEDWTYLFFQNLDFNINSVQEKVQYPFAKRNKVIEEKIQSAEKEGMTLEEALKSLQDEFQIDELTIRMLAGNQIEVSDEEFYLTPLENPIYDNLKTKQEGSWNAIDGETIMDQSYAMGAQLKVWVWQGKSGKRRGNF